MPVPTDKKHNLLFVDDEENILNALKRVFRKEDYATHTCTDPLQALALLEKEPIELIISDHNMPQMTGTEFLEKASAIRPDTVRMILTGFADVNIAVDAINKGRVHRFILKPWNDDDLRLTVRQALQQYLLATENRTLTELVRQQNDVLKKLNSNLEAEVQKRTAEITEKNEQLILLNERLNGNFQNAVRVFGGLIEMRNPHIGNHGKKVAEAARCIAGKMCRDEDEIRDVELAALLHDIGKIGVPDGALKKVTRMLSAEEREALRRHPLLGYAAVHSFQGLERAALFIRHHHEKFDGSGYPDGLKGDDIPLGARIIAVPDRYDRLVNSAGLGSKCLPEEAVREIRRGAGAKFDPFVVQHFLDMLHTGEGGMMNDREMEITSGELKPGMVIARDVRTVSGLLLLRSGNKVTEANIERITHFQKVDPVIDGIYVYRTQTAPARSS